MVCNVIEECRCYAYSDVTDPKRIQFCGVRKGPKVLACPTDCCHGGCPGDFPKEPFRIIPRPETVVEDPREPIFMILILITIVFLLYSLT